MRVGDPSPHRYPFTTYAHRMPNRFFPFFVHHVWGKTFFFDLRKTKYFTALDYAVMGEEVPKEVFEYLVHVFIKANIKVN